jgi:hypothetical protein
VLTALAGCMLAKQQDLTNSQRQSKKRRDTRFTWVPMGLMAPRSFQIPTPTALHFVSRICNIMWQNPSSDSQHHATQSSLEACLLVAHLIHSIM